MSLFSTSQFMGRKVAKVAKINSSNPKLWLVTKKFCSEIFDTNTTADKNSESTNSSVIAKDAIISSDNIETNDLAPNKHELIMNTLEPKGEPPPPPTTCCMSGCHNCVWIDYADELIRYYNDGSAKEKVLEEIEKIEDPSLKAFLKIELS